jgi:hypothetical protein
MPVGPADHQRLVRRHHAEDFAEDDLGFVKLTLLGNMDGRLRAPDCG